MSNIVTRLFADQLRHPDYGVAAIVGMMGPILYPGDGLPDVSNLLIADETRDAWVMNGMAPSDDPLITYPLIRVMALDQSESGGVPQMQSTGAETDAPTVRVAAQVIMRSTSKSALSDAMYLLRAVRAVVALWDHPEFLPARTKCGVSIYPSVSRSTGQIKAPLGDNMIAPGAVLVTFPYLETVPFTLS